jgi:S1-C subfamily serine protease
MTLAARTRRSLAREDKIQVALGHKITMDESRLSRRKLLAGSGIGLSLAIAGCSLGAPQTTGNSTPESNSSFPEEFETPPENPEQPVADSELAQVYRDVVDSVAAIRIESDSGTASGSGWVYDENFVVTNEHVVGDTGEPFVWFNNAGWREATVRGTDIQSDLAVLEVSGKPETATGLPLVEEPVAVGTEVAAIGNPFGLTSSFTTGIVSGRNRNIDFPDREFSIADGIQTDAAVNRGNSGGPLVTHDREVVGVINAGQGDNVGFAISAAMTRDVIPSLIENGEHHHSYLGIFLTDVSPRLIDANDLDITWGVYIDDTATDGPSEGELEGSDSQTTVRGQPVPVGGDVIVRMTNGDTSWPVPNSERLSAFLALKTDPDDTIDIEVVRDGERQTVTVTLGQRSDATL